MHRIWILSGKDEGKLCRVLERDFEVRTLIPMCGTSLADPDGIIVTDTAATHSIGAEMALRRLLVSAVCRRIPAIFLLESADNMPGEFFRYAQTVFCPEQGMTCKQNTAALCRRYGLRYIKVFDRNSPSEQVYEAVAQRCKEILISEDKQHVKTNRA